VILILVMVLLVIMAYGCAKNKKSTDNLDKTTGVEINSTESLDFEKLSSEVVEKIEGKDYSSENTIFGKLEIMQQHTFYEAKNVFYLSKHEEYSGGHNGHFVLEAFDKDGSLVWQRKWMEIDISEMPMGTEPVVEDGVVYIAVSLNLYALDLENGDLNWESLNTGSTTTPLLYEENIYIANYENILLTSIDKNSGTINWTLSNNSEQLAPVKTWIWKNTLWIGCESYTPGEFKYIMVGLDGEILDYRNYARYEEMTQFFFTEVSDFKETELDEHIPENVFDNDLKTAWSVDGNGVGEWIRFSADREKVIHSIQLFNGNHKNYMTSPKYGKASTIRIDFSNGDYLIYRFKNMKDLMNVEKIVLSKLVVAYKMRLTLLETTSPNDGLGISMSEIIIN